MAQVTELETKRLKLRQWTKEDYKDFVSINADPKVMEYYPRELTEEESILFAQKIEQLIEKRGWGFWATELKSENKFIGFVGLHQPEIELPFNPCIEIGWRLSKQYWGNGYATEAAKIVLKYAFEVLGIKEIVSFTSLENTRSQAVMQRINMVNTGQNFQHPGIPSNNPLKEHVLYKITKEQWKNAL